MTKSVPLPEIAVLVKAARNIVLAARQQDQLSSLTVKTVRKQVQSNFSLDEGALEREDVKIALRDAINAAVSEEIPISKSGEKRKRSSDGAVESLKRRSGPGKALISKSESKPKYKVDNDGKKPSKSKVRATKSREVIDSDTDDSNVNSTNKLASTSTTKQGYKLKHKTSTISPEASSVLIDEGPRKRTKKTPKGEITDKKTKPTKENEPTKTEDADEDTVKKLKSLVTACGARKIWSKEFAELPEPKQQIKRLKELLADLGMTSKYSMERARAIKRKRALARELDDVLEFERKAGISRQIRREKEAKAKRTIGELDTDSSMDESSEEDSKSATEKQKTVSASRSIMEYLANQSSDED